MEAKKAIMTRRSVRNFSKRKVSRNIVKDIIECGIHAPSSKNSQPWHFVIDDTAKKNKIADLVKEKFTEEFTLMDPRTEKPAVFNSAIASAEILRNAPTVILVFSKKPYSGGREEILKNPQEKYLKTYESEISSIAAAIQNMLIAANSKGVGSLWNSDAYFISEEIEKLYGQEDKEFICAICLGYSKSKVDFELPRKPNYEFVEEETHSKSLKGGEGI